MQRRLIPVFAESLATTNRQPEIEMCGRSQVERTFVLCCIRNLLWPNDY